MSLHAELFRTVVLVGEVGAEDGLLRPGVPRLQAFLEAYAARMTQALLFESDRRHLLFARRLNVSVPGILAAAGPFRELAGTAHRLGLAVELSLRPDECRARPEALREVLGEVDALYLSAHDDEDAPGLRALVDALLAARPNLLISGRPSMLRATGLFEAEAFNARYMTLFPEPARPQRVLKLRGAAPGPCRPHLRLYIDAQGRLYPCAGMVGVEGACMGNIDGGDIAALWADRPGFDFGALAAVGPTVAIDDTRRPLDLCAAHRERLVAAPLQEPA